MLILPERLAAVEDVHADIYNILFNCVITNISRSFSPPLSSLLIKPEQSKNTCAHNNSAKNHRNGIKKKKRTKYVSTRGMDPKFLRNQKFCKKYNNAKRVVE